MAKTLSKKSGKMSMKAGGKKGKSRTRTTVRHNRKNFNLEHGSKRNNMKRKTNTKRHNSLCVGLTLHIITP
jgi:hypothetical protein